MIQKDLPLATAPLGESVGYQCWELDARCCATSAVAWETQSALELALLVVLVADEPDPVPAFAADPLELHAEAAARTMANGATTSNVRFLDRARFGAVDGPM